MFPLETQHKNEKIFEFENMCPTFNVESFPTKQKIVFKLWKTIV